MLLLSLLFLELSLFDFEDFLVGFPALLSVKDHVAFGIKTVGNLREWVVATVVAESNLLIVDSELLPAEVTLIDESTDAADSATIQWEELYTHLDCYVLEGEVSTDQPDVEALLLLLFLFEIRNHFGHLFLVIFAGDPALLVIIIAWGRRHLSFWLYWHGNPLLFFWFF